MSLIRRVTRFEREQNWKIASFIIVDTTVEAFVDLILILNFGLADELAVRGAGVCEACDGCDGWEVSELIGKTTTIANRKFELRSQAS